jgi:hypothetical protein
MSKPKNMPSDYEPCGDCGYDHSYEYEKAYAWHNDRQFLLEEGKYIPFQPITEAEQARFPSVEPKEK